MTENNKPVSVGDRGIVLHSLDEMQRFAKLVLASNMTPKHYTQGSPTQQVANVCVALQYGLELGFSPMQSLQGIAVINGKPTVYGDSLIALCYASGLVEDIEETLEGKGEDATAVCKVKRRGVETPIVRRFGIRNAKIANLWGNSGPWKQYPDRMLQMRAGGFALRDAFPDYLRGVITVEEAEDYPTEEPREAEVVTKDISEPIAALEQAFEEDNNKGAIDEAS